MWRTVMGVDFPASARAVWCRWGSVGPKVGGASATALTPGEALMHDAGCMCRLERTPGVTAGRANSARLSLTRASAWACLVARVLPA